MGTQRSNEGKLHLYDMSCLKWVMGMNDLRMGRKVLHESEARQKNTLCVVALKPNKMKDILILGSKGSGEWHQSSVPRVVVCV